MEVKRAIKNVLIGWVKAKTATRIEKNVEATAASWGLFPNGAATKKDQLANDNPKRILTRRRRAAFVWVQIL